MILTPTWISIVTAIGAFCVSAISIFLGYKLFLARATGAFKFAVRAHGHSAGFESVAPGVCCCIRSRDKRLGALQADSGSVLKPRMKPYRGPPMTLGSAAHTRRSP